MEHTSLTKNDINDLSLPEVEGILEGINTNNSTDEHGESEKLSGASAVEFLMSNGGQI